MAHNELSTWQFRDNFFLKSPNSNIYSSYTYTCKYKKQKLKHICPTPKIWNQKKLLGELDVSIPASNSEKFSKQI